MAEKQQHFSNNLPRVLIVSRRTVRKNKFVDFVGEYHLDLIVKYGAVPVIVPRVSGVDRLLESFEPIHGVLLCEGEDIDPSWYKTGDDDETKTNLSPEVLEEIRRVHPSDTAVDREKDNIELRLAKLCLERNIPYLGICRGSQVLNVASGGTLYTDVGKELQSSNDLVVMHIDYENYDGHRHGVKVVENTPLHQWFKGSLEGEKEMELKVNSYHHQGVKKLARRFVPMAFSPDGLIEGFYDPECYNPVEGKFIMGLQFHPERMRKMDNSDEFDYPGCPSAYQEFVKAVIAYQKKVSGNNNGMVSKENEEEEEEMVEKKRKIIVRSFSLARNIYNKKGKEEEEDISMLRKHYYSQLQVGAEFLEWNITRRGGVRMGEEEEEERKRRRRRLKEMGATVRNASLYVQVLKMKEEELARKVMEKMSAEQLSELSSFYQMMSQICSDFLFLKNPLSQQNCQ